MPIFLIQLHLRSSARSRKHELRSNLVEAQMCVHFNLTSGDVIA